MLDCCSGIRPLGGIAQRSPSARWRCAKIGPIDEHHDDDSDDDEDDDANDDPDDDVNDDDNHTASEG